jgi:hypothetical protein
MALPPAVAYNEVDLSLSVTMWPTPRRPNPVKTATANKARTVRTSPTGDMTGTGLMTVLLTMSVDVLFEGFPSSRMNTTAVLTMTSGADGPTLTTTVIVRATLNGRFAAYVQFTWVAVEVEQTHPVPLADTKVSPVGSASVTEIGVVVGPVARFRTVSM